MGFTSAPCDKYPDKRLYVSRKMFYGKKATILPGSMSYGNEIIKTNIMGHSLASHRNSTLSALSHVSMLLITIACCQCIGIICIYLKFISTY